MTVGAAGSCGGDLVRVVKEISVKHSEPELLFDSQHGKIQADLSIGAGIVDAQQLQSNIGLAIKGYELGNQGFLISSVEADKLLSFHPDYSTVLKPYMNGDDLTEGRCDRFVIDFFGLEENDARKFTELFEIVAANVRLARNANTENRTKEKWWLFRRSGEALRLATAGLPRFIGTTRTARRRVFQFLPKELMAESKIVIVASADSFHLGVLSSQIHVCFATAAGGWLGVGNDPTYNHVDCFNKFPFPDCAEKQKRHIGSLAEELDVHRKRAQAKHKLGLTDIYNVLEKLRAGEALTEKDKAIHEAALVATLRQLHDELDAAVADAYGWPWPLSDAEILQRVVDLNTARAAEEKAGTIRWLRPEYQAKGELLLDGGSAHVEKPKAETAKAKPAGKQPWPATLAERIKAVEHVLAEADRPLTEAEIAKAFARTKESAVAEIVETLCSLGRARAGDEKGTFIR